MPFSRTQFFDVFAAYNAVLWPVALLLWLATAVALAAWLRGRLSGRLALGLLAVQWAWAGLAYHAVLFARINPVAPVFAALFVLEAGLLARTALGREAPVLHRVRAPKLQIAGALWAYALAYPLLAVATGHAYPRTPTFGVPCPATLLTVGVLLATTPVRRSLAIVPVLWSVIGGSAALVFGIAPDLMLLVAAVLLAADTVRRGGGARGDVA